MSLKLTNTITRKLEDFIPIVEGQVNIYCCGVTVYDLCHLGHARSYIVWDVLRRYLIWKGLKVTFVQNFTDIDDKIINRALQENTSINEITERNINKFHEDMDALGILRPDRMPRATRCLEGICDLISQLIANGSAYCVNGDVYFSIEKFSEYGKLSGRDITSQEKNIAGRITQEEEYRKNHPFDFALWKKAKPNEPSFPSPWGKGRPGWHIECSAMVKEELGITIDIHLGGADLIFPHHENEIAQSEAASGKDLAKYWLHNGMVNVAGQKMSKSLGNFTTIRALLQQGVSPMTLRLFVLQAHYRKPLDFTKDSLDAAAKGWMGLNSALELGKIYSKQLGWNSTTFSTTNESSLDSENTFGPQLGLLRERFINYMDDDLNTSGALGVLFEIARPLKSISNRIEHGESIVLEKEESKILLNQWKLIVELSKTLGLETEQSNPLLISKSEIEDSNIRELIDLRMKAKGEKDFAKADQIRDELKSKGIELIDKPNGITEWIRK